MNRNTFIIISLVLCLIGGATTRSLAKSKYAQDWVDQYPGSCQDLKDATTVQQSCVICHSSGFGLNLYGQDFKDNNLDLLAIEGLDSDGDGRTNADEINNDCTLPGDAVSPVDAANWGNIKVLFR